MAAGPPVLAAFEREHGLVKSDRYELDGESGSVEFDSWGEVTLVRDKLKKKRARKKKKAPRAPNDDGVETARYQVGTYGV